MVMTVVRMEITGGIQQHDDEFRQLIVESVRSTVSPILLTRRRKKSRLSAKKRDVLSEILKRVERASNEALQLIPQVGSGRLDGGTQPRRKRLDKLSPERRELYERIKKLRDEVGSVDFNIVDTLREMREST